MNKIHGENFLSPQVSGPIKDTGIKEYRMFTLMQKYQNILKNIVLRDRRKGGYGFCKPAGVISSQGAKPRGMK